MKNKKVIISILLVFLSLALYASGQKDIVTSQNNFIIEYPENMKERGLTDLVLPEKPQRVAALLTKPVRTLHLLGVPLVAIPTAGSLPWPEDLSAEQFVIPYDKEVNIEGILLLNPDLVILGDYQYKTYGNLLSQMNIPVYYVDNSSSFSYENTKSEILALAHSFDANGEGERNIIEKLSKYEQIAEDFKATVGNKSVLIIQQQGSGLSYQTIGGTVGFVFEMLGFGNCYSAPYGMGPFSYEANLQNEPDLIVYIGSSNNHEENINMLKQEIQKNKEYWGSFKAIEDNKIIVLDKMYSVVHGVSIFEQQEAIMSALQEIGY